METESKVDLQVGIFVFLGLLMVTLSILFIGAERAILQRNYNLYAMFPDIYGLQSGAKVRLAGLEAGRVTDIRFHRELAEKRVIVRFTIDQKLQKRIREDSMVSIKTLGVLGDKYISITPGSDQAAVLQEGAFVKSEEATDVEEYLRKGGTVLDNAVKITNSLKNTLLSLEEEKKIETLITQAGEAATSLNKLVTELDQGKVAANLRQTSAQLSSIMTRINSGQGTLGALINDPALYEDVKEILGGPERGQVMHRLIRQGISKQDEIRHALPSKDQNKRR